MASSNKRRKAAADMREEAAKIRRLVSVQGLPDEIDLRYEPPVIQDAMHHAGIYGKVSGAEVLCRLADLIDPTCEVEDMELIDECDEATPYTLTLSCGHIMGAENSGDIPDYCPVCGARVVSE